MHCGKASLMESPGRSSSGRTHSAINEGIPLRVGDGESPAVDGVNHVERARENILRSPSGLRLLYGDFGPGAISAESTQPPADEDFNAAFWVSTKQNGIQQVWAPRWTMFSRGNVKEKARLLAFHDPPGPGPGSGWMRAPSEARAAKDLSHRVRSAKEIAGKWAVDLYAGIGYFTFSYAQLGLRVLCWELNPWSVEGLKRAALANRWTVRVVKGQDLQLPTAEALGGGAQIVVFLEDNKEAKRRINELRSSGLGLDVLHLNCGFLPSSIDTWRPGWEVLRMAGDAWLHLHENVGLTDIDARREEIQDMFGRWAQEARESKKSKSRVCGAGQNLRS